MTDGIAKPTRRRWLPLLAVVAAVALMALACWWYLRSSYFAAFVRARVVNQLESSTGGRVEIGKLDWKLSKLDFDLQNVTIHGLEDATDVPYVHVDRVFARFKVGSLFHRALGLRLLELDRPVVHIIVYPDGSTNQPRPRGREQRGGNPFQPIFEFSINKADVRNGQMIVNDRPIPIDFAASEVDGSMTWFKPENRYDARVHAGKIDAKIKEMRPFAAVVDAELKLWPHAAELTSLDVRSGRTRMEASARLDDFRQPTITANYRGTVDVGELGSIARIRQMRSGTLQIEGKLSGKGTAYQSSGRLAVRQLNWQESWANVGNASAEAEFSVNRATLVLSHIAGQALGGAVSGEATVKNWCGSCVTGNAQQHGDVRMEVAGASVQEIATALSTRALPFRELKPRGRAAGTVGVIWTGEVGEAVTQIDATVEAAGETLDGGLPVSGIMKGSYYSKSQTLDMASFSLATTATQIKGTGKIGKNGSGLRLSASTSNLNEFQPLLTANGLRQVPIELRGRAAFDGVVRGVMSAPVVSGNIDVTDFESNAGLGDVRTTAAMHWDQLSANFDYGPKLLVVRNGLLRRGAALVNLDGSVQLTRGEVTPASLFAARVAVRDAQMSDLQQLAGTTFPIEGVATLNFQVNGTRSEPRGNGRVLATRVVAYGERAQQVRSDVSFVKDRFQFENIAISDGPSRIAGRGSYDFANRAYSLDLRGTGVRIENVHALQKAGVRATGVAQFHVSGIGTFQAPAFNGDLTITRLAFGGEQLGNVVMVANTSGELMRFDVRSEFLDGSLIAQGSMRMRDSFETNASAHFDRVDLRPIWLAYSKGKLTGRSYASGELSLRGSLREWRNMDVSANVSDLFLPVENMQVRNAGPLKFAIANQVVKLDQFHVTAEDTDLNASGTTELAGEQKIDMRADGRMNLKLIQTMQPDFTSYGTANMNLRITGDLSNPRTFGRIQIANAGISYIDVPIGLSEINGTLAFNRDRLQVETLTARTGGGYLNLNGYVTYGRSVTFNLQAAGSDIRVRYPQGISSIADANLRLTGTPQNALLAGDVVITKFGVTPQFDLATYIARSRQPVQAPKPNSLAYNIKLDVHVTSSSELQVQTALAKVSGNVDLRVRGTAARPAVLGRVNIVEGDVSFQGTKYHVERGDVTFTNPMGITPVFDVAASTRVRDYDITLGFHGSTDRLTTTYRSDPPLATADIIALLAFGRTREESARQLSSSQAMTEQASNAILGQALNATVSNRMQKLFGVSRIKIDPEVGGAENNPSSARVTIEQQVAKNLTITYITDLARSNQQIISAEYSVTRAVSILAVRDQYGIVSFDVRIRQRKK